MRISWLGAGVVVALGAAPRAARASDSREHVEIGPDLGATYRPAASGGGASYGVAVAYGAHAQVSIVRFLRLTVYYARTAQGVALDAGAIEASAAAQAEERLVAYTIGARLQPTWHATPRLHLWLNVGAGWGIMTAPIVHVSGRVPYEVGRYGAAFTEIPLGLGGEFDVVPGWAGVTLDLAAGPAFGGFDPRKRQQTINAEGNLVDAPSLPPFASTWSAMFSVVAHF